MKQPSFFDDEPQDHDVPVIASEAEVRELAREYFNLSAPLEPEPPMIGDQRRLRAQANGAHIRGLVARWSRHFGYISIHDPVDGIWYDVPAFTAPSWAKSEARKRKDLYKAGDRHAYDLTSAQMEELWIAEHPDDDEGIIEDHPIEDDA